MTMNQHLAQMFGTEKLASDDNSELKILRENFSQIAPYIGFDQKTASANQDAYHNTFQAWIAFEKQAASEGIDLSSADIREVASTFLDWAGASGEDKVASAAQSYLEKIASEVRSEEQIIKIGTEIGQVAAHAYLHELNKRASKSPDVAGRTVSGNSPDEIPSSSVTKGSTAPEAPGGTFSNTIPNRPASEAKGGGKTGHNSTYAQDGKRHPFRTIRDKAEDASKAVRTAVRDAWVSPKRNRNLGIAAGSAVAGAGAAYGIKKLKDRHDREKEAFDLQAAKVAYQILVNGGIDGGQAEARLLQAVSAGAFQPASDDVKIAAATSGEEALQARAVELVEEAGYTFE
jgi:hypothetical protein